MQKSEGKESAPTEVVKEERVCVQCNTSKCRTAFSNTQWRKAENAMRCRVCTSISPNDHDNSASAGERDKNGNERTSPLLAEMQETATIERTQTPMSGKPKDKSTEVRTCVRCKTQKSRGAFSKTQWKKPETAARCISCTAASTAEAPKTIEAASNRGTDATATTSIIRTPLKFETRPQRDVPGFEGKLTVCRDWPQTKSGRPPNAQSLVFNPLLACVLGPLQDYSTSDQIEDAIKWWSLALPAWPRWIEELRNVGVHDTHHREKLLKSAKGHPNPLIPRARGRGTVPHFKGKIQVDTLELVPMVAIEIYACVTCLYSQAALDESEGNQRT